MPRLILESETDIISLDEQLDTGYGVQVHSGVTGMGLPPVAVQWLEGAGDGATFRGSRSLVRDIDLPLSIKGKDRAELQECIARLARAVAGECLLRLKEDVGDESWFTVVRRVGGGTYTYGADTVGEDELRTVLTFRAGDPYWTASKPLQARIMKTTSRGLLPNLAKLQLSDAQVLGQIRLDNPGDAPAYPIWKVTGPGTAFEAVSPAGERIRWEGTLLAGQTLTVDTRAGTILDHDGLNRYFELAPAPRMWQIPPGTTIAEASVENPTEASSITCSWRPRKWMVV